ncbi:MAG: M50 family peptidase [Alphaproteobacteria bacterium]|nr:MAG: M50 family peptidase [Alphaproteobacteria bacterium]
MDVAAAGSWDGAWWAEIVFAFMICLALAMSKSRAGWPLKWAETFYHELSHGIACVLTGGKIVQINLRFDGSGLCTTRGGWRVPVLLAGYAGAALWGGMLYMGGWVLGEHGVTLWLKLELAVLAVVFLFWARDWRTWVILLIISGIYVLAITKISSFYLPLFLQFAGLYVLLNAIRAPLFLIDGQHVGDGAALADIFYVIPEGVWIAVWFVFALVVMGTIMVLTLPQIYMLAEPLLALVGITL